MNFYFIAGAVPVGMVVHPNAETHDESNSDAGENPKGGTGYGVRLLVDWILSLS